ncbi:hypothetical protein HDV04_001043 [Boothiomyces sp. JEL0838]|nr:hypothetical protein HDV04_001043 [Boothiomyces sp. JEL0838]
MIFIAALLHQTLAYTGDLSFYGNGGDNPFVRPAIGACAMDPNSGVTDIASANFVAVSQAVFDPSKCGQCVQISYNGKTAIGANVDRCPGCKGAAGLDLSPALFLQLADSGLDQGILPGATWEYVTCPSSIAVHTIPGLQGVAGAPIVAAGQAVQASNTQNSQNNAPAPNPVPAVTQAPVPIPVAPNNDTPPTVTPSPLAQYLIVNPPEGPAAKPIVDSNGCGGSRIMFCIDGDKFAYCSQPTIVQQCPYCKSTSDNIAVLCNSP